MIHSIENNNLFTSSRVANLIKGATCLIVIIYLANCLTPFRMHVDTMRYFAIKERIEVGYAKDADTALDYLPYGYTALLLLLSKIGILKSFTLVLINCLYLFGALFLIKKLFGKSLHAPLFFLLVLLSWVVIKFTLHPLSEMQYLFFSILSLYLFYRYTKTKQILAIVGAFAFAGLAFITRSVGITLIAGLITGLCWQYKNELRIFIKKYKFIVVILVLIAFSTILFSKQLGLNHYTGVFTKQFSDKGVSVGTMLGWHFSEWAEITINTSGVKIQSYFPAETGKAIFIIAGLLVFSGFVYLLYFKKNETPFIIKSYLFFYFLLMFNWPFYDPRFWVPVLPLMIAILVYFPWPTFSSKIPRVCIRVIATVYIILGLFSLCYLTFLSFNKKAFAKKQANGVYRNEYETVFFGKPLSDTAKHIDTFILKTIKNSN